MFAAVLRGGGLNKTNKWLSSFRGSVFEKLGKKKDFEGFHFPQGCTHACNGNCVCICTLVSDRFNRGNFPIARCSLAYLIDLHYLFLTGWVSIREEQRDHGTYLAYKLTR